MRAPKRIAVGISACLTAVPLLLALVGPALAAATTRYVATTGSDAGNCTLSPCLTLQYAINQSTATDTINVAAGTYTVAGLVSVDKQLTIKGVRTGVDACGRTGPESILRNSQGTSVSASGVVIDGLTVQDSAVAAYTGYGLWINPGQSGTVVMNTIFQDNIAGIGLSNAGPVPALIRDNAFLHNNKPGGASGSAIYTDQYVGGAVSNVVIDSNCFTANNNAGIGFSNDDLSMPSSNIEISNNVFDRNGRGVYFYNTSDIRVHDNRILNSTVPTDGGTSVAIAAFGDVDRLTILNNDLLTGAKRGIRVGSFNINPNSNVEAHYNNIVGFAYAGLEVDPGGHVGSMHAECNWWGAASGPTNDANPGGTGDKVIGDAIFRPWLIGSAPSGACLGGQESTPGKVTGGGQVLGDPLFSSLGALLSAPAIVASLADPKSQATFGFVAQCCAARGNLEFNDHQAGVRIKALSITGLFISDSCDTNTHAVITGTAQVTTSIGTSNENFTVRVDDCNEPGSSPGVGPDMFGIQTDSYVNAPQPLIGGNIQIHK
jgi:parallel beta-helix repeat protein